MAHSNHPDDAPPPYTPREGPEDANSAPAPVVAGRRMSVAELATLLGAGANQQRRNSNPDIERERLEALIELNEVLVARPIPASLPTSHPRRKCPGATLDWPDLLDRLGAGLTWRAACVMFWATMQFEQRPPDTWPCELDEWADEVFRRLDTMNQRDIEALVLLLREVLPPTQHLEVRSIEHVDRHSLSTMNVKLQQALLAIDLDALQTLDVDWDDRWPDDKSDISDDDAFWDAIGMPRDPDARHNCPNGRP